MELLNSIYTSSCEYCWCVMPCLLSDLILLENDWCLVFPKRWIRYGNVDRRISGSFFVEYGRRSFAQLIQSAYGCCSCQSKQCLKLCTGNAAVMFKEIFQNHLLFGISGAGRMPLDWWAVEIDTRQSRHQNLVWSKTHCPYSYLMIVDGFGVACRVRLYDKVEIP